MTARHRDGVRPGALGLDLRTLPGRARAQAGPLLLVVVLLALVTALASAGPRAVARVADEAVADAVARAGSSADVVLTAAIGYEQTGQAADPHAAEHAVAAADALASGLRERLGDVLAAPVTTVTSVPLELRATTDRGAAGLGATTTPTAGETTVRVAWLHGDGTGVTWTAGRAPGAEDDAAHDDAAQDASGAGDVAPVPVGLSRDVADALGAGVGTTLTTESAAGGEVTLEVTGVFEADRPDAAAWDSLGGALVPRTTASGPATTTQAAALLTDAALPALLEAVDPRQVTRTVRLSPAPALGAGPAQRVLDALPAVRASPAVLGPAASGTSVHTGLGATLGGALDDVARARAQAGALVLGVVAVGVLLLLLTAGLLARRRTGELTARRTRGARLPALAVEQGVEAVVVVALGAGAGLVAAAALLPGPPPGVLVLPAALVTLVALPAAALRTARAADPRPGARAGGRDATGRQRSAAEDAAGRRTAVELALVALAGAAVLTLHRAGGTPGGPDLLGAAAPAALAAAVAAGVARALPAALRRLAPVVARSRRAVPVLAVARARSDGLAALPLLALGTAAALVVVSVSAALAVDRDRVDASWAEVGGDVRVEGPAADVGALAGTWASAAGVELVVTAEVLDGPRVRTPDGRTDARVLVGDPAAFRSLAAATGRAAPAPAGDVEIEVDGTARALPATTLPGSGTPGAAATGAGPWGAGAGTVVLLVDAADLAGAPGDDGTDGVAWLVGPGAAASVRDADATDGPVATDELVVTDRATVLAELRAEVLPRARAAAGWASAGLLAALVSLTVLVAAARGGPERRRALDTLRTVGLGDAEAWRVAAGELAPGAVVATVVGAVAGCGVSAVVLAPLSGAAGVVWAGVAWWAVLVPVLVGVATAGGVVLVEQGRGGTHRLGEVLRATG